MRAGSINLITNTSTSFFGISIGNLPKREQKTTSQMLIEEARAKLEKSPATDCFKKTCRDCNNIEDLTTRNGSYSDDDNYALIKSTIKLKKEVLKEQLDNLANAGREIYEAQQVVEELTQQLAQIDALRREYNAKMSSFVYGSYRSGEGFNQLAGYDKEKNILNKYFISEIHKDKNGMEANVPSSVLFFGPRGNGKSTFADAFSQELGCEMPVLLRPHGKTNEEKCDNLYSKMLEKAQNAKEEYEQSGKVSVIALNELDVVQKGNPETIQKIAEFMKTCYQNYHCIVFASTNYPLNIPFPTGGKDTAFPCVVAIEPPNRENKKAILKYYLENQLDRRLPEDKYGYLADMLESQEIQSGCAYSVSQIKNEVCKSSSNTTYEDIIDRIASGKAAPNLDKDYLAEFQTAYRKLMINEIEE